MKKALWYVTHQETHIHTARMPNDTVGFYFLRKETPGGYQKLEIEGGMGVFYVDVTHSKHT